MFSRNRNSNTPAPARPKTTSRVHIKSKRQANIETQKNNVNQTLSQPNKRLYFIGHIVHDSIWLFMLILTAYLAFSLASFHIGDPSFFNKTHPDHIANWGGMIGAYLADAGYYGVGLSIWWVIVAACVWLYKNFRAPANQHIDQTYIPTLTGIGLGILMLSSPVLEHLFWAGHFTQSLPLDAGGYTGKIIASGIETLFGRGGGIFMLIAIMFVGIKLMVQFSYNDTFLLIWDCLKKIHQYLKRIHLPSLPQRSQPKIQHNHSIATTIPKLQHNHTSSPNTTINDLDNNQTTEKRTPIQRIAEVVQQQAIPRHQARQTESGYIFPDLNLLKVPFSRPPEVDNDKVRAIANSIVDKLAEFGVNVTWKAAIPGPVLTRYEIEPARGVKGSRIVNLSRDLARSLSVQSVRIVETIAGKNIMGIELPNEHRQEVLLQEILSAPQFSQAQSKLSIALGKNISGDVVIEDLAKMPHLLVGGMTGSGKSVGVNTMIMSMLYKAAPDEVRFVMIDPKMLELSVYEGIPHLLCPVITDMKAAGNALNWCVEEMEKRYRLLSHLGVRNLMSYNDKILAAKAAGETLYNPFSLNSSHPDPLEKLPHIVIIIDELADLMMTEKKTVETQIARLAQKARAAGIHMIIATQRPSVDVITGLIKANIPTRIAFTVQSRIDSRTILDQMGAEDLLKYGDMLFLQPGEAEPIRIQGAFVSDEEVHKVVTFIKSQAKPNYINDMLNNYDNSHLGHTTTQTTHDELFDQAIDFVLESRKTSISALQRHLHIGYNRAANLMQAMENEEIVSSPQANGIRRILKLHSEEQ